MRILTTVSDTVTLLSGSGAGRDIPPDLVQDIRRVPSAFTGFRTEWKERTQGGAVT